MTDGSLQASVVSNAEAGAHNCLAVDATCVMDYSRRSLGDLERVLAQCAEWLSDEVGSETFENFVRTMGRYVMEVARREFGGEYRWSEEHDEPVIVCGGDATNVGMLALTKVRGRLGGDAGDNIPFFYEGFAAEVARTIPGRRALYV